MTAVFSSLIENFSLLIKVGVFTCFFVAAAVAVRYNENKRIRTGFLVLFFTFILVPGLTGLYAWPFFSWHLYEAPGPERVTFDEIRVADGEGNEIRYDARASPPIVGSIARRYANAMVGDSSNPFSRDEIRAQACYFLSHANDYREQITKREHGTSGLSITPRHQRDFRWTTERLRGFGEFDRIRIYTVDTTIADDGSHVSTQSDELIIEVTKTQCDNVH
jgi:hypothetical protein